MQLSPLALVAWPRLPSSDPRTAPTTSIAPPRLDEQSETSIATLRGQKEPRDGWRRGRSEAAEEVEGEEAERSATFAISEHGRPAQFDWLPWLGVTGSSRARDGPGVDKQRNCPGHEPRRPNYWRNRKRHILKLFFFV
jgi:hypothetical protein